MKRIRIILLLVVLVLASLFSLISINKAWAEFHWQRLGRAPLIKKEMKDVIDLQRIFPTYRKSVIKGISLAEPDWDAKAVEAKIEAAIKSGRVRQVRYCKDQEFIWMVYRPRKTITVVRDVVWSSSNPLTGFEVEISCEKSKLVFFIPSICGNISLVKDIPLATEVIKGPPEKLPTIVIKRIYFPNWGWSGCYSYSGGYYYHHRHYHRHYYRRHYHKRHYRHYHRPRQVHPPKVRTR